MSYVLAFLLLHPLTLLCYVLWARTGLQVFAALGFPLDVLLNYTTAALIWGWPRWGEWTISKRLRTAKLAPGRAGAFANWLANTLNNIKPGHVK